MPYKTLTAKTSREWDSQIAAALIVALNLTTGEEAAAINEGRGFRFMTDAGIVEGHIIHGHPEFKTNRYLPGWVHFCFADPMRANSCSVLSIGNRLNPYSGKWNWMFTGETRELESMIYSLQCINPRGVEIL